MKGGYYILDLGDLQMPADALLTNGYTIVIENIELNNIDKPILLEFNITSGFDIPAAYKYSIPVGMSTFYDRRDGCTAMRTRAGAICGAPNTPSGTSFVLCALDMNYTYNTKELKLTFSKWEG